jgi:hypothetical protein
MGVPVPLSREGPHSPRARLNRAEIPFGILPAVFLCFMAAEAGFIAKRNTVADQFLTDVWLGVYIPVLPK